MRIFCKSFFFFIVVGFIACNSSKTERSKRSNAAHSMPVDHEKSIGQYSKEFKEEFGRQLFKGFIETSWNRFCKELQITEDIEKDFFSNMDRISGLNGADLIIVTLINSKTSSMSKRSSSIENEGVGKLNYTYIETEIQAPMAIVAIITVDTKGVHEKNYLIQYNLKERWIWPGKNSAK